jgi:type II secretion system protein F
MGSYFYKASTAIGQTVEGSMEGKNEQAVVQNLHQLGYIPIRIVSAEEKESPSRLPSLIPQRIGLKNLLVFTQEFSTLVAAGLPIDRSLEILGILTENLKLKRVIQEILKEIREGRSLGEALEQYPRVFSKLYVNMVKAGESGGFLETILSRLVKYLQSTKEIHDTLVSVMIYPLILTIVSGGAITILVTFVIPRFAKIFSDTGQALPLPTQIMMLISQSARNYWWVALGVIVLIYIGIKVYKQSDERKLRWDRSKLGWVMVGNIIKKIEVARFSRTLGTLLQSGVPILPALNLVKETSQNLAVAKSIAHIHDRLREGKSIFKSLEETRVFPPLAVHMIAVGEETGRLDEMLNKVAETYEENVQTTVKRLVSLLEPVIILVMAVVVGFIVMSMLLAVISLNDIPF